MSKPETTVTRLHKRSLPWVQRWDHARQIMLADWRIALPRMSPEVAEAEAGATYAAMMDAARENGRSA